MEFLFVGNAGWIDFVNTSLDDDLEFLPNFESLLAWSTAAKLIDGAAKRAIVKAASSHARDRALREARALRGELRRAADRILCGENPRPAAIARVNELLREHPRIIQLRRSSSDGWQTVADDAVCGPLLPLAAVAEDFAEFLATADLSLLRRCEKDPCRVLFYDTSRNHARRWCSMQLCGNRTKVARHRARHTNGAGARA